MSREKRRIRHHIDNLNSPDKDVSARAEGYLLRYYGARALDELIEACSHSNPVVRYRAVWVLGDTQDPRAYDTILGLIDDPDDGVRYDATLALGILGDMRAVEPLMRILLLDDDSKPAHSAFAKMGPKVVLAVRKYLESDDTEMRWAAVQVLGVLAGHDDAESTSILTDCLKHPDSGISKSALYWLEEAGALPNYES